MKKAMETAQVAIYSVTMVVVILSVVLTVGICPSLSGSTSKYNDGSDFAFSHQIIETGVGKFFKENSVMAPALLAYAALDKKWDGELHHLGLLSIFIFLILGIGAFFFVRKKFVGLIFQSMLTIYFAIAIWISFSQVIDNTLPW